MIYETVVRCIKDLRDRWTELGTGLQKLGTALPPTQAGTLGSITATVTTITAYTTSIIDPTETGTGYANVQTLLSNARTTLNDSYIRLGRIEAGVLTLLVSLTGANLPNQAEIQAAVEEVEVQLADLRQLIEGCLQEIEQLTTPEGGRASLSGIRGSVDSISTYPLLTQETSNPGHLTSAYPASSGSSAAPLAQVVEGTLRNVLGWRPKKSDHKGFVGALTQSFPCEEVEGQIKCVYSPRTYAIQVQADMGAVTGAQASIYTRAKVALDQSLMLLDRLSPLRSDSDAEETDAARAIVRSELTELVNELGLEGGPRVNRVDTLFDLLRGAGNSSFDPEQIKGQLLQLRQEFGLTRGQVNTIEEEQNLTDFITLVDYVNSLYQSWDSQRRFFDRSSSAEPFLGTQLVLVSRTLAVMAESVQELNFAMDSVFLGAAERQTTQITFTNSPPMFIAELLAWVERVASEEGPHLINDGGKAGVIALNPIIERLGTLVREAMIPPQNPKEFPEGYGTARVQRALKELVGHLDETATLIGKIRRDG